MASRKTKRGEEDELSEDEDEGDDGEEDEFRHWSREHDDELALPESLLTLSKQNKKELLRFKRTHNEVDWEAELVRRQELIAKKIDLERLKRMKTKASAQGSTRAGAKRGSAKSSSKSRSRRSASKRRRVDDDDDEDESEEEEEEEEEEEGGEMEGDESENDLFDSDEEREITSKRKGKSKDKKAGARKQARARKARAEEEDEEEEEEEVEEEEEEEEEEGEEEEDEGIKSHRKVVEDTSGEATLTHYQKIQVRRFQIEAWLKEPFFQEAVKGCFVRFHIGRFESKEVYRMCEVLDVENNHNKQMLADTRQTTTKRLTLKVGSAEKRGVKIDKISNSGITEDELQKYLSQLRDSRVDKPLTQKEAEGRRAKLSSIVHKHNYTHEEIASMIEEKSGVSKLEKTSWTDALENLSYLRGLAIKDGRMDDVEKLDKQRQSIENSQMLLQKQFEQQNRRQLKVNQRNRDENFRKDIEAGRRREEKEKLESVKGGAGDNPFERRQTRPKNLWSKTKTTEDTAAAAAATTDGPGTAAAAVGEHEGIEKQHASATNNSLLSSSFVAIGLRNDESSSATLDAIRLRVKQRLNVDSLEAFQLDPRTRYLQRACEHLPPKGSNEREELRKGQSLAEYLAGSKDMEVEE